MGSHNSIIKNKQKTMRKVISLLLIFTMVLSCGGTAFAGIWEFGMTGQGVNPFEPRGFMVETNKGSQWLSSNFDNSEESVKYTSNRNGVDYLGATKEDGSDYTFYAMTDRNPDPGRTYLAVYKNGNKINLGSYTSDSARAYPIDPSGSGNTHGIPIKGFSLEAGCKYEFFYLRGMKANNGIALILYPGKTPNQYKGYIQDKGDDPFTSEEKALYDDKKNEEYKFVRDWKKDPQTGEFEVNEIYMRFSVQTYADISAWDKAADKAQKFLDSVTDKDLQNGKYKRKNITRLKSLLKTLDTKAQKTVRKQLEPEATKNVNAMVKELDDMLDKAMSEVPDDADLKKLNAKIKEGEALYNMTKDNTGLDIGQYGVLEVELLGTEIKNAKGLDKYDEQADIDEQVQILDDAIIDVRMSLVLGAQRVFYDSVTGIYVIVPELALPEDVVMSVVRIGKSEKDYINAKKKLSTNYNQAYLYNIQFYENEQKVYPSEKVEVQIPIADSMDQNTSVVYSVADDSGLIEMTSVRANGMQVFQTESLGKFMMAGSTDKGDANSGKKTGKFQYIMEKMEGEQKDKSETKLDSGLKKKEDYKDPKNDFMNKNIELASYDNNVRQESNPMVLLIIIVALVLVAVAFGVRAFIHRRQ